MGASKSKVGDVKTAVMPPAGETPRATNGDASSDAGGVSLVRRLAAEDEARLVRTHSLRTISFEASNVMVAMRVRPLNPMETRGGSVSCLEVTSSQSVVVDNSITPASGGGAGAAGAATPVAGDAMKRFAFDSCFGPAATQAEVYETAAQSILAKVIEGYNGCVFAYGQTGAGKTHTMEGTKDDPGVIPRLCEELFEAMRVHKRDRSFNVRASYVEIYQEVLRDLLVDDTAGDTRPVLAIREDGGGVFVEGCEVRAVDSYADVAALLTAGTPRRAKGETRMNAVSSRSHAVLSLEVEQHDNADHTDITRMVSKLHLIDLAGSERQTATGATGKRLKEGASINQSLSALGNVINALTIKGRTHVPYRDSKLTRLLQDSLGGNSRTLMICCVSPATANREETTSSLRFAERAKKVRNKAKRNIDPAALRMAELLEENRILRERVAELEARLALDGKGGKGGCCAVM